MPERYALAFEQHDGINGAVRLVVFDDHASYWAALDLNERTAGDTLRPWSSVTTVADDMSPAIRDYVSLASLDDIVFGGVGIMEYAPLLGATCLPSMNNSW